MTVKITNSLGKLYIVATPIGNLKDITLRAIETLTQVDLIAAEDTRHSQRLLQHYSISTPMLSLHEHNEDKRSQVLLNKLKQGTNIALISDAGTPLISDPGYRLVSTVRAHDIEVIAIPGPCAAISALSASGLSTDHFIFEGFLPSKTSALRKKLAELSQESRTIIFYEAPHRLLKLLDVMIEILGAERYAVLAKELTKTHETIRGDTLINLKNWLQAEPARQKGEFVLLLKSAEIKTPSQSKIKLLDAESLRILHILLKDLPSKQAVALSSEITGADKKELYKAAIESKR